MSEDWSPPESELKFLRDAIHDLNNRVGVILATSELLQLDAAEGKPKSRCHLIEQKSLEAREILSRMSERYFD